MNTRNGGTLSGSWEMDQMRIPPVFPKAPAAKVVKYTVQDEAVRSTFKTAVLVTLAALMFAAIIWQHENTVHRVGKLQALVQKNQDDGAALKREVKALEP
jgi:cell division protein FtsB